MLIGQIDTDQLRQQVDWLEETYLTVEQAKEAGTGDLVDRLIAANFSKIRLDQHRVQLAKALAGSPSAGKEVVRMRQLIDDQLQVLRDELNRR